MKGIIYRLRTLLFLLPMVVVVAESLQSANMLAQSETPVSRASSTQARSAEISGVWSGTFESSQRFPPFTMTVTISKDAKGRLIGDSNHDSTCLKNTTLHVTVTGSRVVMAGSDKDGDSITLRGIVDPTGTQLNLKYIINGSASGRCESDNGTGNMGKR